LPAESRAAQKPGWMMNMDDGLYDRLEAYSAQAQAQGLPLAAYALQWVLSQSAVVSALVGVRTKEQIDDALNML